MPLSVAVTVDVEPPIGKAEIFGLLDILARYEVHATFFITGMVLKHYVDVAKTLLNRDHELALHGYSHYLWQGKSADRKKDALRAISVFDQIMGEHPAGFRAPYGNIDEEIMRLLEENMIQYDSSIIPAFLRVEGGRMTFEAAPFKGIPSVPYHPAEKDIFTSGDMGIVEIPFSVLPIVKVPIGFGFVTLFGLNFYKFFLRFFVNELMVFYIHPYQLLKGTLSAGVPTIIKPLYRRCNDPTAALEEFFRFITTRFSPRFMSMQEIVRTLRV